MKKMLVSASQEGALHILLINNKELYNYEIEHARTDRRKGNIYIGRVIRIEPSLEAAFIDYGCERHGFLPLKEIAQHYFKNSPDAELSNSKPNIQDVIKEGQLLLVQVQKDERGSKGAALTTFISLAGSFLVLMPKNPKAGGISKQIEGADRTELRNTLAELTLPQGMGVIIRTAGVGKDTAELQRDLDALLSLWQAIAASENNQKKPRLIHQESGGLMRSIRDHLHQDIEKVIIDSPDIFAKAKEYVELSRPEFVKKLELHSSETPLFVEHQIAHQIEAMYQREIRLPSGGSIVIDQTEALVAIDINSSRATKGQDIEETAFNTNLEAVQEIAKQLRLRDIGGLIVIDFIDMRPIKNQREVENTLYEALKNDRARVQTSKISRFGLLELSRQRLRTSFEEESQETCPRCLGRGSIQTLEFLTASLLAKIEESSLNPAVNYIQVQLPVEIATFIFNERRQALMAIEKRQSAKIMILANPHLDTPHYKIKKLNIMDSSKKSHQLIDNMTQRDVDNTAKPNTPAQTPMVDAPSFMAASAKQAKAQRQGLLKAITRWLKQLVNKDNTNKKRTHRHHNNRRPQQGNNRRHYPQNRSHGSGQRGRYNNTRGNNTNRQRRNTSND